MNAISVTMVKGTSVHFLQGFAFRAVAAIVLFSWAGMQLLLISGAFHKQEATNHALLALLAGVALLFYSLYLHLRLRRLDATPSRESAQLYFGTFLALLPFLTWFMWRYLRTVLIYNRHLAKTDSSGHILLYTCVIISVIYFVAVIVWLQTNVPSYDMAKPGSWSDRAMRWIHSTVLEPYFK
jgi:hypothetical protein